MEVKGQFGWFSSTKCVPMIEFRLSGFARTKTYKLGSAMETWLRGQGVVCTCRGLRFLPSTHTVAHKHLEFQF